MNDHVRNIKCGYTSEPSSGIRRVIHMPLPGVDQRLSVSRKDLCSIRFDFFLTWKDTLRLGMVGPGWLPLRAGHLSLHPALGNGEQNGSWKGGEGWTRARWVVEWRGYDSVLGWRSRINGWVG